MRVKYRGMLSSFQYERHFKYVKAKEKQFFDLLKNVYGGYQAHAFWLCEIVKVLVYQKSSHTIFKNKLGKYFWKNLF